MLMHHQTPEARQGSAIESKKSKKVKRRTERIVMIAGAAIATPAGIKKLVESPRVMK
jgi:hypothetical protein